MISFIFSSKKTTIKTSEVSDLMNFTQKRIEMMKAYSNAIDAFSNSDNQKAYEEMVQASKIARELADSTTDYDDTREYTTLADYYFAKAQSYLEKKDNDLEIEFLEEIWVPLLINTRRGIFTKIEPSLHGGLSEPTKNL